MTWLFGRYSLAFHPLLYPLKQESLLKIKHRQQIKTKFDLVCLTIEKSMIL